MLTKKLQSAPDPLPGLCRWTLLETSVSQTPLLCHVNLPFPQIDIIGAMMTFCRVKGKIVRSVLCSIVCNNCAQRNAHTYEQT